MIELEVTNKILMEARGRAKKLGRLHNSITKGAGNLAGYVGQLLVAKYLEAEEPDDYNFDVKKDGTTYEVKTKRCTSRPKPEYDCSVSDFNTKQDCDYYCFIHALKDYSKVWLKGMLPKHEVNKLKEFKRKGELDGKFAFKEDTWIIKNYQLKKIN